jgi:hypothetical protein
LLNKAKADMLPEVMILDVDVLSLGSHRSLEEVPVREHLSYL